MPVGLHDRRCTTAAAGLTSPSSTTSSGEAAPSAVTPPVRSAEEAKSWRRVEADPNMQAGSAPVTPVWANPNSSNASCRRRGGSRQG